MKLTDWRKGVTMDYQIILNEIKKSYVEILNKNLVGIYIHGSIALNCFNWNKSDIDYLAVVNEALEKKTKLKLMKATVKLNSKAPPKGLEMSVVLKKHCLSFEYPTPYDLHFSNMHLNWYNSNPHEYCEKMNGYDKDLAAHFKMIKTSGIVLYGKNIDDVFGNIPKEYYLDSIKHDIENARKEVINKPVYIILNLCRCLAFVNDGLILSKEHGGKWSLSNIDKQFHTLINSALDSYLLNKEIVFDNEKTAMFCDYIHDKIC